MAIGLEKVQKLSGEVCQRIRNDHEQFLEAYESELTEFVAHSKLAVAWKKWLHQKAVL